MERREQAKLGAYAIAETAGATMMPDLVARA
jgi:hypothetical protein